MKINAAYQAGTPGMPLVVFIHGMGMHAGVWTAPEQAKILGGKYPLNVLIRSQIELKTSFHDLHSRGYPLITWSQSRPAGPIQTSVHELSVLLHAHRRYAGHGIIFVAHSRGGLIARQYVQEADIPARVRGIVTIATPHQGTTLAQWVGFIAPAAFAIDRFLEISSKQQVDSALRRILAFLCSPGLKEMLPGSSFFSGLSPSVPVGTACVSFGGTDPQLLRRAPFGRAGIIEQTLPARMLPEELRRGKGDGVVSARSSVFPNGDLHRNFVLNHAELLVDQEVRNAVSLAVSSF